MAKRQRSSVGRPPPSRAASQGLALGVLALSLGACGLFQPEPAVPSVGSVSPADGATNVPVSSSVVATLELPGDAQLDVTTLTAAAVTLTDSSGAAVAGNRTPQGDTIVFDPTTDLALDESYTFSVTGDVRTSTNVALQAFTSSFSTGDSVAPPPGGLVADRTPVVFTAGGATDSDARTLTLTNGGTDTVNLTGLTIGGTDAALARPGQTRIRGRSRRRGVGAPLRRLLRRLVAADTELGIALAQRERDHPRRTAGARRHEGPGRAHPRRA